MKVLIVVLVAALVASAMAKETPQQVAFDKCFQIGESSGCSGCTSNHVNCGWCVSSTNQMEGKCAPDGFCANLKDSNDLPMISMDKLCPVDPTKEPRYRDQGDSGQGIIEGVFSPFFDSHYCDFPVQPWGIDRSANPFGNHDPSGNCRRVNNHLGTGQRAAINDCLQGKDDKDGERLTPKRLECLRVYQSYLCTLSCPTYGDPIDFTHVCSEYCERLENHCDQSIQECILEVGGVDLKSYFKCADVDVKECSRPSLISTSGKYEYDMCFFGDPKRCHSVDCQVELAEGSKWPKYFWDKENPIWGSFSNGSNFHSEQLGPGCDLHDDWYTEPVTGKKWECCYGHTAFLYRVLNTGSATGTQCEDATKFKFIDDFNLPEGGLYYISGFLCTPNVNSIGGYCLAFGWLKAFQENLPTGLSNGEAENCPAAVSYLYSLETY